MALTPFALRVGLQPLRRSPSRSHGKHSTVYRGPSRRRSGQMWVHMRVAMRVLCGLSACHGPDWEARGRHRATTGSIPDEAEGGDQTMDPPGATGATEQGCAGEAHKALVRRFVEEAVNRGNLDVVADVCAATGFGAGPAADGPESIRELLALYRGAVPDACWTVEQQVAEGDTVVTRFTARGTQQGALLGLAPTARPMEGPGLQSSRRRAARA